jgi:hypothetical protein
LQLSKKIAIAAPAPKERDAMRMSLGSRSVSRLIGAAAALWLGAGSAWAGGGSGDAASLASFLANTLCPLLGYVTPSAPCPQLSSVTELVLENAALENAPPEMVRAMNAFTPTVAVNAGNPPAGEPSSLSPLPLSNLTPLAFIAARNSGGTASVTQLGNPSANSFFYAATDGISPTLPPTTLYLAFDYPPLNNPASATARGNDLADICLPLTVLNNDNTESPVPTLLRVLNANSPPGNAVVAVGSCSGSGTATAMATDLGLTVTVSLQSTPNSAARHAVIEVQIPLLVTGATDPGYFYNGSNAISLALLPIFTVDISGFTPNVKGLPKLPIGVSPVAAQFTASIAGNSGATVLPAVNGYGAIATDGEVLVSAPLP